jgi:uncharacterized damage-inducible protein DinB
MTTKLISLLIFLLVVSSARSQFADSLKAQMIRDWTRARTYTGEYLATMPETGYAFRPNDSIRTFAQQMIHMAQGTVGLMQASTGRVIPSQINRQNLENISSALSKDSVAYFVNLSYDYAIQALKEFDMTTSKDIVVRGSFKVTKLGWMLKAFEHQTHHRGQMTIYIRAFGLKPPPEKLFDH